MNNFYPWQSEVWSRLNGLRTHLPNSLLLKGSEGIGKLDLAMNFAQSLLCESPQLSGLACQTCPSCHWFAQETNPDFRLIQPDSLSSAEDQPEKENSKKASREISVEQIRSLSAFVNLSAHSGGYRVALIHPAEAMNNNSANALLKTLEEPTDKLLFILVTHRPQQLLPTIMSRSLAITIPNPAIEVGTAWLKLQGIPEPELVLAQSGFAPLTALISTVEGIDREVRDVLLEAIKHPDKFNALAIADQLQRNQAITVIHLLQQWCYDLLSFKLSGAIRYHPEQIDLLKNISNNVPVNSLFRYCKELQIARREAFHPLNPKLLFESLLLAYQQLPTDRAS